MAQGRNNEQTTFDSASGSTLTLASYAINTVANDRKVVGIVAAHRESSTSKTVTGVDFGASAATFIGQRTRSNVYVSLWAIAVGSDTAAQDIDATWSAAVVDRKLGAFTLTDTTQTLPSGALVAPADESSTNAAIATATAPAGNSLGIAGASLSTKDPVATETGQSIFDNVSSNLGNMSMHERASTVSGSFSMGVNRSTGSGFKAIVMAMFGEDLGGGAVVAPGSLMMVGI